MYRSIVERLNAVVTDIKELSHQQHKGQLRFGGWPNRATCVMFHWLVIDKKAKELIRELKDSDLSRSEKISYMASETRKHYENAMPEMPPGAHQQILLECVDDIDWGELARSMVGKD
ncbi:unnamed protein product [marine sediment metagenome]|uniref:Uncharacterized protein n=1 Tax=marine sediment metagenome TaxID=412755 RepID=X0WPJ0_9ZZZZ